MTSNHNTGGTSPDDTSSVEGRSTSSPSPGEQPTTTVVRAKRNRKKKLNRPLLFIDTNIFLDFYRARNDAGISLLSKIDKLHDAIITTCQIEMEFKKNRQKVISESVSLLKSPEFNLATPAFLLEAKTVEIIKKRTADVRSRVETLKARILSTMENPTAKDRIYQTMQRLFTNESEFNLRRHTREYNQIWRKAFRRFLEGRPPRKKDDTSAGDAINWEWIVRCIEETNRDVIIVSRDADYGLTLGNKAYANNWLTEEIKRRVNQQRKLILVDRLSAALTLLDVEVTKEEITSERATITSAIALGEDEAYAIIEDAVNHITDEGDIPSLIAETNAVGWDLDTFDIDEIKFKSGKWIAQVSFSLVGEQDEDKPWHGNSISGDCTVTIGADRSVTIAKISATLDDDGPEEP